MSGPTRDFIDDLRAWTVRQALSSDDLEAILSHLCEALVAAGLPLMRVVLATPTVDPNVRAIAAIWKKSAGAATEQTPHGEKGEVDYAVSPIRYLLARGLATGRFRLEDGEGTRRFPLLADLGRQGGTDYYLRLVVFSAERALRGMALSITSDAPGGFSDAAIEQIERLLPELALAAYRIALTRLSREVLGFYLGSRTSERVLAGEIRRGSGRNVRAAILFADVRHFTAISGRTPSPDMIAWLNEIFERIGQPIETEGGEVLKFVGDGLLAIFPLVETLAEEAEQTACSRALAAASAGLRAVADLAERCHSDGREAPEVDIALHFGDLFYGNIGAARRLDFTVIGPAVNEAARLETLCKELERPLLLSEAFACRLESETRLLGRFPLRGLAEPLAVHALA